MAASKKTLWWLAGWYPSSQNSMAGDFIARHLDVACQHYNIRLFHFPLVSPGELGLEPLSVPDSVRLEWHPVEQKSGGAWARFWNADAHKKAVLSVLRKAYAEETPDAFHVHAPDKLAMPVSIFLHDKSHPLYLTEHWAIYDGKAVDAFEKRAWWFQRSQRQLWKRVDKHLAVSSPLHRDMERVLGAKKPVEALPNVVNEALFAPSNEVVSFRFVHVSGMDERKNPKGILKAFAAFRAENNDAQLLMIGPISEALQDWSKQQGLERGIEWGGVMDHKRLAEVLNRSMALLLFSSAENAPCVISEALCSGLPVVSSNVGGIADMIDSPADGLVVTPGDVEGLTKALFQARELYGNEEAAARLRRAQRAAARYGRAAVAAALERGYGF
ncbi:MAG: hypothetical protein RL577_418 [Bacteroidota bacterium]